MPTARGCRRRRDDSFEDEVEPEGGEKGFVSMGALRPAEIHEPDAECTDAVPLCVTPQHHQRDARL